jgi:STE24 endopeptidase
VEMFDNWIFDLCVAAILAKMALTLNFERLDRAWAAKTRGTVPANLRDRVTPDAHARSADYTVEHSRLGSLETVYGTALKLFLLLSGLIPIVYNWTAATFGGNLWAFALMMSIVGIVMGALHWPFDWKSTFGIEAKYGFNKTTPATWWLDNLRDIGLGLVLSVPITVLVFYFAKTIPLWWLAAFAVLTAYELILTWVYPNWISPLFNKFTPLPEGSLKERLTSLASKAGLKFAKILVMDGSKRSRHANAYFTGLGNSRRIVLFDTLIAQLGEEEVAGVLAHEIGHLKRRHVPKMFLVESVLQLAGLWVLSLILNWDGFYAAFGLTRAGGVAGGFWLVGLVSGAWVVWVAPLFAAWSRKHEYEADGYSAELVGGSEPLISGLKKLKTESLASVEDHPATHAFYASHPTLEEREAALAGGPSKR